MLISDSKYLKGFIKLGSVLGTFIKECLYKVYDKWLKKVLALATIGLRVRLVIVFKFMVHSK